MKSVDDINHEAQTDLRERVKELSCLYNIAHLASQKDIAMGELLKGVVEGLPAAWLYPEAACARIVFDGHSHSTSNYRRLRHRQSVPVVINGRLRGYIEVGYPDKRPRRDHGPFLNEERNLLEAVAKEVAIVIMRKEAEQDRSKLEEQLRHADRLATVGQLAAGVAHELNEPLGHILGFAQLAQKCPDLPTQARADIGKILSTSLYAREIVRKLLIFARQIPPLKGKVDVNHLVAEVLNFLESRFASNGVKVVCRFSPDLPEIDADASQLKQVFVNLIVNALQAMPDGGDLRLKTKGESRKISVVVEDTGAGMEQEVLDKIFTPFFTTKEIGLGTGLGLPVSHGIIASHQGTIRVESSAGKGTVCTIELPVRRARAHRNEASDAIF
ncbi:MAG: ATP-binding protein [Syntrophorhabdaceae bacterium]|nr:ATP-binding protein [Syntrophorhabdaceae bacterium]